MGKKLKAAFISSLLCLAIFSAIDHSFDIIQNVTGDIFYVNTTGSGGAFTSIQDAINASKDGDTVFVYNGTYYENVVVNKTIYLIGEDKNSTIINGGGNGDVVFIDTNRFNITGFTITESGSNTWDAGIELRTSNNCWVFNNIVTKNHLGIGGYSSNWNKISDNNVSNNVRGIYLYLCDKNNITGNNASSNSEIGICLMFSSDSNTITNNNIFSNNIDGIQISSSNNNIIVDNNISFNDDRSGIRIASSINNILSNNTMIQNSIIILGNLIKYWNTHFINTSNIVNNKPVYYWKDRIGGIIPPDAGEVILANCTNVVIEFQNISNNTVGIELGFSNNNSIMNNTVINSVCGILLSSSNGNIIADNNVINSIDGIELISSSGDNVLSNNNAINNFWGIILSFSSKNTLTNNNISSNSQDGIWLLCGNLNTIRNNTIAYNNYGINSDSAKYNRIYHNNFVSNINQAYDNDWEKANLWNDTYPSGGNYWSDYTGVDKFKGPNQSIPGSDGIGDTPYYFDFSEDNYPLMQSFKPLENYTILKQGWNLISLPLIQEERNLTRVLGSIDGWYNAVQWYNLKDIDDPWKHHKINKPYGNDLFEITEKMGFWIHITRSGDTIFIYNGTLPTQNLSISLTQGWNHVGYPSFTRHNRTDGLNNLTFGTHVDSIWTYNAATQKWKGIGSSDYFELGRGYWIHAKTKCEWEVPL